MSDEFSKYNILMHDLYKVKEISKTKSDYHENISYYHDDINNKAYHFSEIDDLYSRLNHDKHKDYEGIFYYIKTVEQLIAETILMTEKNNIIEKALYVSMEMISRAEKKGYE